MTIDYSFSLNGFRKNFLYCEEDGREQSAFAPLTRNLLSVPGLAGAMLESTDTKVRVIRQRVFYKDTNGTNLRELEEELAAWLITDKAVPLIFDDEPDRIYYAVVDGSFDIEESLEVGGGVITFICPDPYKYGSEKTLTFQNAASFLVEGSSETEPVVRCEIKQDTTYVAVSNGDKINLIGNPTTVEQTPVEWQTPIFMHGADTLMGWTDSDATSAEGADITGTLKTDGNHFYTDDYGLGPGWHGPAKKTSIGQAIQDFRFDIGFHLITTGYNQAGVVEVSLLDGTNRVIAKLQMSKHHGGLSTLSTRVQAGTFQNGHVIVTDSDARGQFQDLFHGVLRVYRMGKFWSAFVFEIVNGVFEQRLYETWNDDDGIATAQVTQVQARILKRADFPTPDQKINDIQVFRLNDIGANQVPYIARAGDIIEFDHKYDIIRRNGEDITSEKAFIGEYFKLNPGTNTIVVEPMAAIQDVEVRWRDKWL